MERAANLPLAGKETARRAKGFWVMRVQLRALPWASPRIRCPNIFVPGFTGKAVLFRPVGPSRAAARRRGRVAVSFLAAAAVDLTVLGA